jgi:hypothetical protein
MMLALPEGRYRLSYNGSIRIAPAFRNTTVIWKVGVKSECPGIETAP